MNAGCSRVVGRGCKVRLVVLLFWLANTAASEQITMGLLGDSLTDEYLPAPNRAHTDLAAYNWVQILALARKDSFNFGRFRGADNYWPDTRDAGFEYNWAKVGAAASPATRLRIARMFNMATSNRFMGSTYLGNQVVGLLPYLRNDEVDVVFIGAGSNDFFYYSNDFTLSGSFKPKKNVVISPDFIDAVAGSLLAAVDIVRAAGASKVVLSLVPMGTASADDGSAAVLAGITEVNKILRAGARERDIAVVDLFGFATDRARSNADGSVTIAGNVLTIDSAATADHLVPADTAGAGACNSSGRCAGPGHADHYRAEDGLHPNTLIQGLIANQVLKAINEHYDLDLALLSDDEIVALTVDR